MHPKGPFIIYDWETESKDFLWKIFLQPTRRAPKERPILDLIWNLPTLNVGYVPERGILILLGGGNIAWGPWAARV